MKKKMKIALAIDFTEASDHAVKYALQVFKDAPQWDVSFVVVHAFKPLVPYTNTPSMPVIKNEELERTLRDRLREQVARISSLVEADGVFQRGSLPEVLSPLVRDRDIKLVVMGTREKTSLERLTVGSNTLEAVDNLDCPVLAVPIEAKLTVPHTLTLATDLQTPVLVRNQREWIENLLSEKDTQLTALHVADEGSDAREEEILQDSELEEALKGIPHEVRIARDNNVYRGIAHNVDKLSSDLLMVLPRDRSFFREIFHPSVTNRVVSHAKVPVLIF